MNKLSKLLLLCLLLSGVCVGQESDTEEADKPKVDKAALAAKFVDSMVVVEYYLKYDKGESPKCSGLGEYCSNCGKSHIIGDAEEFVKQERPLEAGGMVIAPDKIITADVQIHERFIDKIIVRFGESQVEAKVFAYPLDTRTVILQVEQLPEGAKSIEFGEKTSDDLFIIDYVHHNTKWSIPVAGFSLKMQLDENGEVRKGTNSSGLVVDADGNAISFYFGQMLPDNDDWQKSPLDYEMINEAQYKELLGKIKAEREQTVLRCRINFRSPTRKGSDISGLTGGPGQDHMTEKNCFAVVVAPDRILIPATLTADTTARLEKITIFTEDGQKFNAKFESTIKDYGLITAKLAEPMAQVARICSDDIEEYKDTFMPFVEVRVQGEEMACYYSHNRISGFEYGWKKIVYPVMPGVDFWDHQGTPFAYLMYNSDSELVVMPVVRRPKVQGGNNSWDRYNESDDMKMTALANLTDIIARPAEFADADSIPLSSDLENRAAWMGVILQALNEELARLNMVSEVSNNGTVGGLVSYVYPGSPAERAGIEPGMILVRLHSPENPQPIDIKVDERMSRYMSTFPWERLDEIPAEYFDRLPVPWPAAENEVGKQLRDIGFGKMYAAELYLDGEKVLKQLAVEETPTYYDSAARHKSETVKLTVRDLTFEVRRYMQMTEADPGVIVSKVEPGGKADVAGIKPFEIVTHINDQPVMNVKEFEAAVNGATELRIAIKRMSKGRVVNIKM